MPASSWHCDSFHCGFAGQGRQRAGGVGDAGLRRPHRAAGKHSARSVRFPPVTPSLGHSICFRPAIPPFACCNLPQSHSHTSTLTCQHRRPCKLLPRAGSLAAAAHWAAERSWRPAEERRQPVPSQRGVDSACRCSQWRRRRRRLQRRRQRRLQRRWVCRRRGACGLAAVGGQQAQLAAVAAGHAAAAAAVVRWDLYH